MLNVMSDSGGLAVIHERLSGNSRAAKQCVFGGVRGKAKEGQYNVEAFL